MKHTLIPALIALGLALPAQAAEVPLKVLSDYISSIKSAETTFVQTNPDGTTARGRLILKRPYRMRFEYAPPDATLVLASSNTVAVYDRKSNQPPAQYPLKKTPLNLILGPRIDLTKARMVVAHGEENGLTTVTAQDPENPEYGSIKLYFTENPVALKAWTVTDDTGTETHVDLGPLATGAEYPSELFDISGETARRQGN
jgi:outer membrane lipoprotein-sorting protein